MLKAAFIPEEENLCLQVELSKTYTKLDYICFINELMFRLKVPPELTTKVSEQVFLVLNKIILDNVFKHVVDKSSNQILHQIRYNTFSKDIFINVCYVNHILNLIQIDPIDQIEKENIATKMIYRYFDKVYVANMDRLNEIIFNLYNYLNNFFHYLNISYYKFEIVEARKPVLIYTERTNYACV